VNQRQVATPSGFERWAWIDARPMQKLEAGGDRKSVLACADENEAWRWKPLPKESFQSLS
jgi:hypothetical protein